MDPISIVVISTMSVIILGQIGHRMYEKYRYRKYRAMAVLAQYDPETEMGSLI